MRPQSSGTPATHHTAHPAAHNNDLACRQYALFFHDLTPMCILFAPLFFAIIASLLTGWIRSITPRIDDGTKPNAEVPQATPSNDVEATVIPDSSEDPPPYQPPPAQETSAPPLVPTPTPTQPKVKRSSAQSFVMGTALFLCIIASLFLAGLGIQALIFCGPWSPVSVFFRIVYWIIFSIPCLWASVGASCWLMLLRDLWGPGMRKRLPIKESALIYGLTCVLVAPFVIVMVGAVNGIEACQRRFCGDALEEESLELEEGLRMEGDTESIEGSGSREEERVELMGGIEK